MPWNRGPDFFSHSALISAPYSIPAPLRPTHSFHYSTHSFVHSLSPLGSIPSFIRSLAHLLLYSSVPAPPSSSLQGAAACFSFACPPWQVGRG